MDWSDRIGRRIKLRDLHIVMAVADTGSMAKAAAKLRISHPAVSKAISEIEGTLGVRLFDRNPQGAELAAYGQGLADKPEIVALSQADTIDAEARKKKLAALKRAAGRAPILLSAVSGEGVEATLRALVKEIERAREGTGAGESPQGGGDSRASVLR